MIVPKGGEGGRGKGEGGLVVLTTSEEVRAYKDGKEKLMEPRCVIK